MSGIEAFLLKALLPRALASAGKRSVEHLFGEADIQLLSKLCREALDAALSESLIGFDGVDQNYRDHLRGLLEDALGVITEPTSILDLLRVEGVDGALKRVGASNSVDWATFGVQSNGKWVRLNNRVILKNFLDGFAMRLNEAAARQDSAVFNFATRLDFDKTNAALASISRSLETLAHSGMASDRDASLERATAEQRVSIDWRHSQDMAGNAYVESSAIIYWRKWAVQEQWTKKVASSLEEVAYALALVGADGLRFNAAASRLSGGHIRCSTALVQLQAVDLELDKAEADLKLPVASFKRQAAEFRESDQLGAITALRWLKRQIETPGFATCFAIRGRFGSGRSRTLTKIAELAAEQRAFSLFLSLGAGDSVRGALMRQIEQMFNRKFSDLTAFGDFLGNEPGSPRMFFLVDDLDVAARRTPGLVTELCMIIDESTASAGLLWCLSTDADQFDAVLSNAAQFFWVKYCTASKFIITTETGWLDLDVLNSQQQLGLIILDADAKGERADISEVISDAAGFAHERRHLVSPLVARMRLRSLSPTGVGVPLTDVNSPPFIHDYWIWILACVHAGTTGDAANGDLENTVTVLAKSFAKATSLELEVTTVLAAGSGERWIDPQGDSLLTLRRAGLLSLCWRGDQEAEFCKQYVEATFAAFWAYRIARTLIGGASTLARDITVPLLQDMLEPWWILSADNEGFAEASCQFVLTISDDYTSATADELWRVWASHRLAPRVPLIMAATGNSPKRQQSAIKLISKPAYKPSSKRELFVALRMLGRSDLKSWRADQRIAVASRQFVTINQMGLSTYLHEVIRLVLSNSELLDRDGFVNASRGLVGSEHVGAAELAAQLMVVNGNRLFAQDEKQWIRCMVTFCQRISSADDSFSLTSKNRDTFVERFIGGTIKQIISSSGARGVRLLAKYGWWTGKEQQIDCALARYMGTALTTTFGATVHTDGPDEAYRSIVEDLVVKRLLPQANEVERLVIAFYLIKHSVPTYGRADVEVDDSFHDTLRILAGNKLVTGRLPRKELELFQANKIFVR